MAELLSSWYRYQHHYLLSELVSRHLDCFGTFRKDVFLEVVPHEDKGTEGG